MNAFDLKKERALVLAPHTDDAEFGCGGTIARMLEEGIEVHVVVFSRCEQSVPDGYPVDALEHEFRESMNMYGIPAQNVSLFGYQVRHFPQYRQAILEDMIRIRRRVCPSLVFAPSVHDIHQDHHTVAEEAVRAFKTCKLLSYEIAWNHLEFSNQVYVKLTARQLETKIRALSSYKTQSFRNYSRDVYIRSQAMCRGAQIGCEYAEVFELVRAVL